MSDSMIIATTPSPVETDKRNQETNAHFDALISKQFDFGNLSTDQVFQVAKDFLKGKTKQI